MGIGRQLRLQPHTKEYGEGGLGIVVLEKLVGLVRIYEEFDRLTTTRLVPRLNHPFHRSTGGTASSFCYDKLVMSDRFEFSGFRLCVALSIAGFRTFWAVPQY